MKIGGLIKFTLIDYPGRVAAVVFTQGCNFRCRYCHNPELVYPQLFQEPIAQEEVLAFLRHRQGTLDGVVVTGGEPTLQPDLLDFLSEIKQLGYSVKLDTNGARPDVLRQVLEKNLADYVAMDIKAPLPKYPLITSVPCNEADLRQSMDLLRHSGIAHEFRTTYDTTVLTDEDIQTITDWVQGSRYRVQDCLPVPKSKAILKVQHTEL